MPTLTEDAKIRITARVPAGLHSTLEEAAELSGATLNQFLVQAAAERAQAVLEKETTIRLSREDAKAVLALINQPPQPAASDLAPPIFRFPRVPDLLRDRNMRSLPCHERGVWVVHAADPGSGSLPDRIHGAHFKSTALLWTDDEPQTENHERRTINREPPSTHYPMTKDK
ncbi:MAG: DUF1778 domain-containing protein [Verrucomicrobiae bacterium]|nr:DUF1778 domain-containing protein [Verrucomicrobiae bacterium]